MCSEGRCWGCSAIICCLFRADIGAIAGGQQHFDEEYRKLGPLTRGEKIVLAVFCITAVPVLAAMAPVLGTNPYALIIACTLGASSAYMMPVGTPPNAIVFGTGLVRLPQMMKAGVWLNLAGILVITALATLLL